MWGEFLAFIVATEKMLVRVGGGEQCKYTPLGNSLLLPLICTFDNRTKMLIRILVFSLMYAIMQPSRKCCIYSCDKLELQT